jgi:hypothetical protein
VTVKSDGDGDTAVAIIAATLEFLRRVVPRGADEAQRLLRLIEWYEQTQRNRVR